VQGDKLAEVDLRRAKGNAEQHEHPGKEKREALHSSKCRACWPLKAI